MDKKEAIGKNISKYRKEKHMSRRELAEKANVSLNAVTSWETGKNTPRLEVITDICDVLDITLNQILDVPQERNSVKSKIIKAIDEQDNELALILILAVTKGLQVLVDEDFIRDGEIG